VMFNISTAGGTDWLMVHRVTSEKLSMMQGQRSGD
jgi:hypothetical protein